MGVKSSIVDLFKVAGILLGVALLIGIGVMYGRCSQFDELRHSHMACVVNLSGDEHFIFHQSQSYHFRENKYYRQITFESGKRVPLRSGSDEQEFRIYVFPDQPGIALIKTSVRTQLLDLDKSAITLIESVYGNDPVKSHSMAKDVTEANLIGYIKRVEDRLVFKPEDWSD